MKLRWKKPAETDKTTAYLDKPRKLFFDKESEDAALKLTGCKDLEEILASMDKANIYCYFVMLWAALLHNNPGITLFETGGLLGHAIERIWYQTGCY